MVVSRSGAWSYEKGLDDGGVSVVGWGVQLEWTGRLQAGKNCRNYDEKRLTVVEEALRMHVCVLVTWSVSKRFGLESLSRLFVRGTWRTLLSNMHFLFLFKIDEVRTSHIFVL